MHAFVSSPVLLDRKCRPEPLYELMPGTQNLCYFTKQHAFVSKQNKPRTATRLSPHPILTPSHPTPYINHVRLLVSTPSLPATLVLHRATYQRTLPLHSTYFEVHMKPLLQPNPMVATYMAQAYVRCTTHYASPPATTSCTRTAAKYMAQAYSGSTKLSFSLVWASTRAVAKRVSATGAACGGGDAGGGRWAGGWGAGCGRQAPLPGTSRRTCPKTSRAGQCAW